jgi:hypothetical protein
VEFQISRLRDKSVHVVGFGGEDSDVMEEYVAIVVHTALCNRRFFRLPSANFPVMFFNSGLVWSPLKMGTLRCSETSVTDYHSTLRNTTEECIALNFAEVKYCT